MSRQSLLEPARLKISDQLPRTDAAPTRTRIVVAGMLARKVCPADMVQVERRSVPGEGGADVRRRAERGRAQGRA